MIPNTGVEARVRVTGTAQAAAGADQQSAARRVRHPALIVFNRPVNELGTGERASLAATAGGIATGFIAAPLGESIGRALDLDLFEITTTTDEGELGAGVTVGQQIGDRAFFKLRQQFGERNFTEFLIEYQLADFLRAADARPRPKPRRLGQPHRPAPHRAGGDRSDLLLQLLMMARLLDDRKSRSETRRRDVSRAKPEP